MVTKMHKVYENNDLMMHLKKRYCHCCGGVLQKKKTEKIVRKGDPGHEIYCRVGTEYRPHGDIIVVGKEYYCPFCNKTFSCEEQRKVINAQKHYKKKIVTKEEIDAVSTNKDLIAQNNILRMRWLLLIPIIGELICTYAIFNGRLSKKTKNRDLHKIFLSSMIIFICVALVIKLTLSMVNINLLNKYKTIIMLIPALLLFNIPALIYINHTFKKSEF